MTHTYIRQIWGDVLGSFNVSRLIQLIVQLSRPIQLSVHLHVVCSWWQELTDSVTHYLYAPNLH